MKLTIKNALILLAITLVSAIALSYVYQITKEPIAAAEQKAKVEAYGRVYADATAFTEISDAAETVAAFNETLTDGSSVQEILQAEDASGNLLGYVLTVNSSKGYGGDIKIALGIDQSATVRGYAVLSHSESPGFGANCENADVAAQFDGITAADQLDGISGATYTTNALKSETQAAINLVKQIGGGDK